MAKRAVLLGACLGLVLAFIGCSSDDDCRVTNSCIIRPPGGGQASCLRNECAVEREHALAAAQGRPPTVGISCTCP